MKKIFTILAVLLVWFSYGQNFPEGYVVGPGYTTAQMNQISAPQVGRYIYNTDTDTQWRYDGSIWEEAGGTGGGGAGYLLSANDLSDVDNAGISRTNLGVEIGVDVLAYGAFVDLDYQDDLTANAVSPTQGITSWMGTQAQYDIALPTDELVFITDGTAEGGLIGTYLPLAAGAAFPLTGNLYLGVNDIQEIGQTRFNDTDADSGIWSITEITNASYVGDLAAGHIGVYRHIFPQSGTATEALHILTKGDGDATYASLTATQTFTGVNSFNGILPNSITGAYNSGSETNPWGNVISDRFATETADSNYWIIDNNVSNNDLSFQKSTNADDAVSSLYKLNDSGTPVDNIDLIDKEYADANYGAAANLGSIDQNIPATTIRDIDLGGATTATQLNVSEGANSIFTVYGDQTSAFTNHAPTVLTEAYGGPWDGSNEVATKDAIYDKIQTIVASGATQLDELSDVPTATNTDKFALMANGTTGYVGRAIVQADISDLAHTTTVAAISDLDDDAATLTIGASATVTGSNSGDQTSIVGITGTAAEFNTAITDETFSGSNTGDQTITLTGDVSGTGTGSFGTTIATDAVDIAMLSATGTPSGTTFLRGDNQWAVPSAGTFLPLAGGAMTGDAVFNDNVNVSFGTSGGEADLYSDGTSLILNLLGAAHFRINDTGVEKAGWEEGNEIWYSNGSMSSTEGYITGELTSSNWNNHSTDYVNDGLAIFTDTGMTNSPVSNGSTLMHSMNSGGINNSWALTKEHGDNANLWLSDKGSGSWDHAQIAVVETGTFTPTVTGSTTGTYTAVVQKAVYRKIGDLVYIHIQLTGVYDNSTTGDLTIGNLPFSTGASNSWGELMNVRMSGTTPNHYSAWGSLSTTTMIIYMRTAAGTQALAQQGFTNATIIVTGSYPAD